VRDEDIIYKHRLQIFQGYETMANILQGVFVKSMDTHAHGSISSKSGVVA
jgi:hypothetical protein